MRNLCFYTILKKPHPKSLINTLLFAVYLAFFIILAGCSSGKTAVPSYSITIMVESKGNWFFNKYDFAIAVDETKLFDLAHGKTKDASIKLTEGEHILVITSSDLQENNTVSIPITSEKDGQSFSFLITSQSSKFVVKGDTGVTYDSSVKASVIDDPTSLIPPDADVMRLTRDTLYSHPFILEGKYIQTVVVPTEIGENYIRAEQTNENEKFLIFWHNDFRYAPKNIQLGIPVVITGKVSGVATDTMHIDSAILDNVSPSEIEEQLIEMRDQTTQILHNMTSDSFRDAFNDEIIYEEFLFVCEQTGISISGISDIKRVEDWTGGKRFGFTYTDLDTRKHTYLKIACNANSSIQSLWCGQAEIYARGYEPYAIQDYISFSETDTAYSLYILSQNSIESLLKYPSSAKFSSDYTYTYDGTNAEGICSISGTVSAKNALGMRGDIPYVVGFLVTGDTATLKYLKFDHKVYINSLGDVTLENREKVDVKTPADRMMSSNTDANKIRLSYNEAGIYGKLVSYDGVESFEYHIPPGAYVITNNANTCGVYVASNDYYKNIDGFMENEITEWIDFSAKGEKITVTVAEGEHIELSIGADITLEPQE